jgi:hypothetical protein
MGDNRLNRGLKTNDIYRLIYVHISHYSISQNCVLEDFVISRRSNYYFLFIRIMHAVLLGAFGGGSNIYAVVMCISSNIL